MLFMSIISYKSKDISTKIISFIIILSFLSFKAMHIPIFISTISIVQIKIPYDYLMVAILSWINILLAIIPLLIAIYTGFVRKRPNDEKLREYRDKNICIIMPIYNEDPIVLWDAIQSIMKLKYDLTKIHLYLSFDDDKTPDEFIYILEKWNFYNIELINNNKINIEDNGMRISICRSEHGGKKVAQKFAFMQIEKDYTEEFLNNSFILLIDSDIKLKSDSLSQFIYHIDKYKKACLTGLITCSVSNKINLLLYYQDVEYVTGQIFWRNTENILGSTTCLPGAFTILKYDCLKRVSEKYFNSSEYQDIFDYHRFYLGEDRYLTHLLMEDKKSSIGYCELARCKTEAPTNILALLKQRRRWYLGHIANDTWMISSYILWKSYPVLSLFNFFNNARNTSIYVYLLYTVLALNQDVSVLSWLYFVVIPIVLYWIFVIIYALQIRRRINIIFYLSILAIQPMFNMMYMYYSIYTFNKRSWGGIRSDLENKNVKKN
jgi:chitin synthase